MTETRRPRVMFLCTGNSCRSQMGEGWARALLADRVDACSAGTDPHGLNPLAVRAMREVGVDISAHTSKTIDACDPATLDLVVTVCGHAHEHCPVFLSQSERTRVVHRGFDDPPKLAADAATDEEAMAHYRRVRDEIRAFVETVPTLLARDPAGARGT
ncbi:MAG: arsenate reductase ArsC [Phycisphaerales bacterium]